ncbi:MAG TPA: trypsin-like peptidase domain-containing protein [Pseudonocardiaceae bacterium]|jgi:V8-like Glu-specific endopeptidase|nr:trypsin-like peptidase domain-containing protein [Pseudonocardiaceae bacterium]
MRRRLLILVPVLALVAIGVTASVASPWNITSTISGIRPVSEQENAAATQYWATHPRPDERTATAPKTTTAPPPVTTTSPSPTAPPAPTTTDQPDQPDQSAATTSNGAPTVGALFATDDQGDDGHFCSASVVNSPQGDLVLTAAHCIYDPTEGDYDTDIVFIPDYHDGQEPYGVWVPSQLIVDPRWISDSDQDLDFGFMVVRPSSTGASLQSVTGANQLGTSMGFDLPVQVTGYPDGASEPVTCSTTSSQADTYQMRFDCDGFPSGTSGSPWVTDIDPQTGLGTVVGVIGGYEEGGDTPQVSYSSYFDDDIRNLYNTAVTQS